MVDGELVRKSRSPEKRNRGGDVEHVTLFAETIMASLSNERR
jgi:hypothetical protein